MRVLHSILLLGVDLVSTKGASQSVDQVCGAMAVHCGTADLAWDRWLC